MKAYTFVKNTAGSLYINLNSFNMTMPEKTFVIPVGVNKITVPYHYAIGMFVSPGALKQFELGYFTIEDYDDLAQEAVNQGLTAATNNPHVYGLADIAKALQDNNLSVIDDILTNRQPVELNNLLTIVRENIDKVPSGIIDKIEQVCGAEIRVDE